MAFSSPGPEKSITPEFSGDRELYRIQEFMDTVARVECVTPNTIALDCANDDPVTDAIRRFENYELRAQPTFYTAEQLGDVPPNTALSFMPRVARGGKRSFHGVFFGDLEIGSETSVPVAVKPHKDYPIKSCLNDYLKNEAIRRLGFYTPGGVGYVMDGDKAYSLTVLDETLTTLDSIDWSGFLPDTTQHPGMQEMWREVSQQTAILHGSGSTSHGDLAARNIATSADGGTFIIDWEKARIDTRLPRDVEVSYNNSFGDLSVLLDSMCRPPHAEFKAGIGLFYGKNELDWWQSFRDIFFDEYCEVRLLEVDRRLELNRRKGRKHHEAEVREELARLAMDLKSMVDMEQEICAGL